MTVILGIETSCDDTAAALVDDQKNILAMIKYGQDDMHKAYGGVVPEVAARAHLDKLDITIKAVFKEYGKSLDKVDAIAATSGPGLIGGVLVGAVMGKAIAAALNKPFIPINHLEGHVLSARLVSDLEFPYMTLLVSGGHSQIIMVKGVGDHQILGSTRDDALGECFDKIGKAMGLDWPAGPILEKFAQDYSEDYSARTESISLPRPLLKDGSCDFSFSGLKSAAIRIIQTWPEPIPQNDQKAMAYALHEAVIEVLKQKLENAIQLVKSQGIVPKGVAIVGGVGSNQIIRQKIESLTNDYNLPLIRVPPKLCTDNGAMIAWAGIENMVSGLAEDALRHPIYPRWPVDSLG